MIINQHLTDIQRLFTDGVKLTLIGRFPGDITTDMIISDDDDLEEVIRLIERRKSEKRT